MSLFCSGTRARDMHDEISCSYGNGFWRPEEEDVVTINGDLLTADPAGASHASLVSERLYRVQQSQHSHVTDSGLASSHRTPYLRGPSEAGAQRSMEIVLSWNPPAAARDSIGSFLTNTVQRESSRSALDFTYKFIGNHLIGFLLSLTYLGLVFSGWGHQRQSHQPMLSVLSRATPCFLCLLPALVLAHIITSLSI